MGADRWGVDALLEAVTVLQGAPLVASALEVDVLPQRVRGYQPADLDALCVSGELVWVGAGGIGHSDGRIRLARRHQANVTLPVPTDLPDEPHHRALLEHLARRGASFWPELVQAVGSSDLPYDEEVVLAALWDLVWAGAVTNDSLAPLRAMVGSRSRSSRRGGGKPRGLRRTGPPEVAGRWSLVAPLLEPVPSPTEAAAARALQLLDRYGVLTREMALAEGVAAGFAGVYPVLKSMEEQGKVRRGYFVAGLGAAQFAKSGAVDRLRNVREPDERPETLVLASTDPAQPYGASLAWPESQGRPARSAGSRVIVVDGRAAAYLERGGRSVTLFDHTDGARDLVAEGLEEAATRQRIEVSTVDGVSVAEHPLGEVLVGRGWRLSYRGLRPPG